MDAPLEVSADAQQMQNHVVICGYGRGGRNLLRLMQEHKYLCIGNRSIRTGN
jgi:CPA2 family monovalent cation:H+ antiporter-2